MPRSGESQDFSGRILVEIEQNRYLVFLKEMYIYLPI